MADKFDEFVNSLRPLLNYRGGTATGEQRQRRPFELEAARKAFAALVVDAVREDLRENGPLRQSLLSDFARTDGTGEPA